MLNLTGNEILQEFGKGKGMSGSGCVATLTVLSGAQLLISVCKLTAGKQKYRHVHAEISDIQQQLEEIYLPRLMQLFNDDTAVVKSMLRYRIMRDKETDPAKKEAYKQQALEELEKATDTMIDLCATCLDIIPMALHLYQVGVKSAQGDTGVALSTLLSGASSGLYTTLINIKTAKGCEWTNSKRAETEKFFGRLHEYQYIFSGRLAALYNNTLTS